ncbi:MAG TPA: hypothetical protein VJK26_00975 [Patescibacteria group bacterium]|nr:hypothetical protein [Patescibacteria group bacterium]
MPNLTEIIQQIQQDLSCPVCGKNYETGEIRLRGLFDHTLIVQTICGSNHMTLFMTSFKEPQKKESVCANDIIDLHRTLERFDGDFASLWTK